jgi:phage pi2 protein 07
MRFSLLEIRMSDAINVDKLTKIYLKIKEQREDLSARYKAHDSQLEDQQNTIKSELLKHLQEQNIDSIRTPNGTFYRTTKTKYWTSDWESMHSFILEHELPDLLEKRLHQTNMRTFLEENKDLLPQGLNVDSEYSLSVRRPKK